MYNPLSTVPEKTLKILFQVRDAGFLAWVITVCSQDQTFSTLFYDQDLKVQSTSSVNFFFRFLNVKNGIIITQLVLSSFIIFSLFLSQTSFIYQLREG